MKKPLPGIGLLLCMAQLIIGCATGQRTYHMEVGGRYDSYREQLSVPLDQALTAQLGTPVTVTQGDPSLIRSTAAGFHVGLTEQTNRWVTRLALFYSHYETLSYRFRATDTGNSVWETLMPSAMGLDASIGYQVSILRPHLSYKYQSMTYKATVTGIGTTSAVNSTFSTSEAQFLIGGGLTLDLPIFTGFHLVADADYRVPLRAEGSIREWTAQAGLRFGAWQVGK